MLLQNHWNQYILQTRHPTKYRCIKLALIYMAKDKPVSLLTAFLHIPLKNWHTKSWSKCGIPPPALCDVALLCRWSRGAAVIPNATNNCPTMSNNNKPNSSRDFQEQEASSWSKHDLTESIHFNGSTFILVIWKAKVIYIPCSHTVLPKKSSPCQPRLYW